MFKYECWESLDGIKCLSEAEIPHRREMFDTDPVGYFEDLWSYLDMDCWEQAEGEMYCEGSYFYGTDCAMVNGVGQCWWTDERYDFWRA